MMNLSSILRTAILVAGWCALWQDLSIANVLSGILVSLAVQWILPETGRSGGIRPVPLAKLAGIVARDLAQSTVSVAGEILTPTDYTDELTAQIELPPGSNRYMLALTVLITLTPGTAVVDTEPDECRLLVHLLHGDRLEDTTRHINELALLLADAFPHSEDPSTSAEGLEGAR